MEKMDGFDSMAMPSYLGSPAPLGHGSANDEYLVGMSPLIPDQHGTYDTGDFAAG